MTKFEPITFIVLVLFILAGVAVTNTSPELAHNYWVAVVLVFAIASIFSEIKHAKKENQKHKYNFARQIVHWVGTLVAVLAVYSLLHTGGINYQETSLVMLLIIALSTFLAGIYAGWRFYLLGVFLLMASVFAAYIEKYLWILMGIGVALIVITMMWLKRKVNQA